MSGRFPNVDWWCDYCGALLNYQNGFDDSNDTWACTECGTINRISASEIYESHKDYRKRIIWINTERKHQCTNF